MDEQLQEIRITTATALTAIHAITDAVQPAENARGVLGIAAAMIARNLGTS